MWVFRSIRIDSKYDPDSGTLVTCPPLRPPLLQHDTHRFTLQRSVCLCDMHFSMVAISESIRNIRRRETLSIFFTRYERSCATGTDIVDLATYR